MTFNPGSQGNVYLTGADDQGKDIYDFDYQTGSEYCYPVGYSPQSTTKISDWTFSSSGPYLESPLSSAGALVDSSWNPFDQSFQSSINNGSYPSGNPQPSSYQTSYSGNIQSETQPFVSLAPVTEKPTFDDMVDDEYPRDTYKVSPLCSPAANHPSREPNWGSRRNSSSSSSSKLLLSTKRHKSSDKGCRSSHSHHRSKSESMPRLRSTTQLPRSTTFSSSSSSSKSPSSNDNSKGRTSHNQVEKQYRNRLNGQFETLLNALPSEDDRDGAKSRVSKAEVLMLAKRHIVDLEREKMMLETQRQELESDVEELKRRFVETGGVCMP